MLLLRRLLLRLVLLLLVQLGPVHRVLLPQRLPLAVLLVPLLPLQLLVASQHSRGHLHPGTLAAAATAAGVAASCLRGWNRGLPKS